MSDQHLNQTNSPMLTLNLPLGMQPHIYQRTSKTKKLWQRAHKRITVMYSRILFKQVQNPNNPLQQIKQLISSCNDSSAPYTNFRPAWFSYSKNCPHDTHWVPTGIIKNVIAHPGVAHLPFWQRFQSNSWATSEFWRAKKCWILEWSSIRTLHKSCPQWSLAHWTSNEKMSARFGSLAPSDRSPCLVCQDQERHCHDVCFLRLQGLNVCDSLVLGLPPRLKWLGSDLHHLVFFFFGIFLSNIDLKNMISTDTKEFPFKNDPLPDIIFFKNQIIRFLW